MASIVSRTVQSYLTLLAIQTRHYATLRLFGGIEAGSHRRLCLDAQVPAILGTAGDEFECALMARASHLKDGVYVQDQLCYACHYDAAEVMSQGPLHWGQLADTLAFQLISQLAQWHKDKREVTYIPLEATTALKPDRQRFYI